jgi:hypothetical protein
MKRRYPRLVAFRRTHVAALKPRATIPANRKSEFPER